MKGAYRFILIVLALFALAPFAHGQTVMGCGSQTGSIVTSFSVTLNSTNCNSTGAVAAGSVITVVTTNFEGDAGPCTRLAVQLGDNVNSGLYTQQGSEFQDGSQCRQANVFTFTNSAAASAGAMTVTGCLGTLSGGVCTAGGHDMVWAISITVCSGCSTSAGFIDAQSAFNVSGATASLTTPAVTTSQSGDVIIGVMQTMAGSGLDNLGNFSVGSPYTLINGATTTNPGNATATETAGAAGSTTGAPFTWEFTASAINITIALKASSAVAGCGAGTDQSQCGTANPACASYTPPSTTGATQIASLPFTISSSGTSGSPLRYYLASDLSVPSGTLGGGIIVNGSFVDINLNGHTMTFGAGGNQTQTTSNVGQYGVSGDGHNVTIENGTITELSTASGWDNFANCKGASVGGTNGNNPCAPGGNDEDTYQPTYSYPINMTPASGGGITVQHVTLNYSTVSSDGIVITDTGINVCECNTINNSVVHENNRAFQGGVGIYINGGTGGGDTISFNTYAGGPEGGLFDTTNSTIFNANYVANGVGNSGQVQYTNDYCIYAWGRSDTVENNYCPITEGRGIETYSNAEGHLTGMIFSGNEVDNAEEFPNNYEYQGSSNTAGCEIFGTTGMSLDTGTVAAISNETHKVIAGAKVGRYFCMAGALMLFDEAPGTSSQNSTYIATVGSTFTTQTFEYQAAAVVIYPGGAAGSAPSTGFVSTNDTFAGDTTDFYVDWDGVTGLTKFINPTIVKPVTATGDYATFRFASGTASASTTDLHFQDAVFQGGASESSSEWGFTRSNNGAAGYDIDWTFNLTVKDSTGLGISGASVTITGADSAPQCGTLTTNSSGQVTCVVNERHTQSTGGAAPVSAVKTPFVVQVVKSGYPTLSWSQPIDSPNVTVTKQMGASVVLPPLNLGVAVSQKRSGKDSVSLHGLKK